jgi:hypothetical protein
VILTPLSASFAKAREVVKGTARDALRKSLLVNEVVFMISTFAFSLGQASVNETNLSRK